METYFNIRYEFDVDVIHQTIDKLVASSNEPHFIPVVDGVVLNHVNSNPEYKRIIDESIFSICDSSYVPLYIRWIYGECYKHYSGSQIFIDIVKSCKYRMIFMGTSQATLNGLKENLKVINPGVVTMKFVELPYLRVEDFDYAGIAKIVEEDNADIVWIALGAPKQEIFMSKLKPHLHCGVMIAVGAAFKFFSGVKVKRAPQWMINAHMEFVYRIFKEPRKQLKRCYGIVFSLPTLFWREWKKQNTKKHEII